MLFYEDGYIYDTDTGSKECESPALLYNLRNAGIVIEGYMSTLLYVLFDARFKNFSLGVDYVFCRKTFEPYLSTMSDIVIELYEHDTDGLRYYNDVRDLNNALYKIKFCSLEYFHYLENYLKEHNCCRMYQKLAVCCYALVGIFGDLPANLQGFLMELQHTL